MQIYRRVSLAHLYPVVEFSFSSNGTVYKLIRRSASKRADRYTLEIINTVTKRKSKRHFTFDGLLKSFVYLRDDAKNSKQPKRNICITVNCLN